MISQKIHNVFFVDDNEGVRKAVAKILAALDYKITCFANAADCLEKLSSEVCDLIITDMRMPEIDGFALLSRVKRSFPHIPVIVITAYGDILTAVKAMKIGAGDFIEKPLNRNEFLHKVELILKRNDTSGSSIAQLTKAEINVLKHIIEGKSNKEIANALYRSRRTIEVHRARMMRKLCVDNSVDLTKKAITMGLVSIKDIDNN